MEPLSLIGAGISVGSALIGWLIDQGHRAEAQRILERAQNEYGSIEAPVLEKIAFQELGPTAFAQIKADPSFAAAQRAALDKLGSIADSGGLTLEDQAVQAKTNAAASRASNAGYNRIREDMARTGNLGGGADVAMRLANQQATASRYADTARDTAAAAQRRAFDAIISRGQLGGQMRSQDFNEQATVAQARDRIAAYNNELVNRGKMFNQYTLPQTNYQNRLAKAQGNLGIARDKANMELRNGQNDRSTLAGVGQGVGSVVAGWPTPQAQYPDLSAPTPFDEEDGWRMP